jgi:hypothetical protein
MLHSEVRRVPWATIEGTDKRTHESDLSAYTEATRSVEDQLDALGYR